MRKLISYILFLFIVKPYGLMGQSTDKLIYSKNILRDSILHVNLDSVLVISSKKGLSAQDFIEVMQRDTLFYEAFRNMKKYTFIAENNIKTYDDENKLTSKIYRKILHNNSGEKYYQKVLEQRDSGKVYKRNGDFDLYTVKMFAFIFMNDRNTDFINEQLRKKEKDEEGYKDKLKTLIFNPGRPVEGVPLISEKTKIFDPKYRKYYNYTFHHATYHDSIPVYQFKCVLKPELSKSKKEDMLIKELTTLFDVYHLDILARNIHISYESIPFDFDIKMSIELTEKNGEYLPEKIRYSGFWDVPFNDIENCSFNIKHYNYKRSK